MYDFTRVHPPLLRDDPDVRGISEERLHSAVAATSWATSTSKELTKLPWLGDQNLFQFEDASFSADRFYRWVIIEPPVHYAEDVTIDVTEVTGFKETQRRIFERSLGIEGTGGQPPYFSETIKLALKLSDDDSKEWRSERTVVIRNKFLGSHTYIKWNLLDTIRVTRTTSVQFRKGNGEVVRTFAPSQDASVNDCVIGTYQDGVEDPAASLVARTYSLYRI